MSEPEPCTQCKGRGVLDLFLVPSITCPVCEGTGKQKTEAELRARAKAWLAEAMPKDDQFAA